MELLRLKEAMSNAPHAQQLAAQFAADAEEIGYLLHNFNTACSYVYQAQERLAQSYLQMSEIARLVGSKNLTVQPKNADFENVCLQFSSLLEELAGMHRAHAEELRTTLFMPPHKLPSQPGLQLHDSSGSILFSDLPATHRNVESCGREVHASLAKYMKLTRRCSPKEHDDAVIELSQHRRMFQKAAVIYHARLNAAHFEREMVPLNAFFGFLTTLRNHSKKINEVAEQTSLTDFSEVIKSQFDCRQVQSTQATEEFLNTLTNIQSLPLALFAPEPLFAKTDKSYLRSPDTSLFSKSGYLYMRVKKTFGFDWNEVYCFTQGGNLLCQQKGDLGAGVLVNLNGKGVFAEPVDIDDRRYTFQIVSAAEKRSVILQAENSTDRDEWIQTISNVILNTSSWARTGQPPPDLKFKKEPQPFVLVPKLQFMGSPEPEDADEEGSLQQALRASLSCSDWIAQSPPYHSELIATGAQSAPSKVEFEVPVTFIGCMPLPEFLVNRSSVDEMATHILSKRIAPTAEGNSTAGQACVARIASEGVFILEPGDSGVVLSHFKLPQVVHCADMSSIQPGLLLLMTSKPHSAQWCDLPPGDFHLCHFFETPKAGEFAERLLNLQLTLLATMNEEGDSPEKACIIANIMRSSEWNASTASPPPPMPVPAVLPQSESPPRGPSPFQPPTPQPSEPSQQPVPATNEPVDSKTATQELLVELATGPEPQVHPPPPPHSPPAAAAAVSADEPPLDAAAAAAPPVEVQPPDTNPSSESQL